MIIFSLSACLHRILRSNFEPSNVSALAIAREKYSNGMNLKRNRELPFPDDELDTVHNRLKNEAMLHFLVGAPVQIAAYKEQLIQVMTFFFSDHLYFVCLFE